MSKMFNNPLTGAVVVSKTIDHFVTSADARLMQKSYAENLDYMRSRDSQMFDMAKQQMSFDSDERRKDRDLAEWSMRHQADMNATAIYDQTMAQHAAFGHIHDLEREKNVAMESIAAEERRSREYEQSQERNLRERMANADREADIIKTKAVIESNERRQQYEWEARQELQQRQLSHDDRMQSRQLAVQQNIANQQDELQRYLAERNIQSSREIAQFKALAYRETQILLARETAQNMLQDRLVQDAMKEFPLDIAPLVLLGERKDSLNGLLRFSISKDANIDIETVYRDVKRYATNPEALKIFIAPIHLSSTIKNREELSNQIWDTIYHNLESFFTQNYDSHGAHPVTVYPIAWKPSAPRGVSACETMHFFLRDIPCVVIEPKFDGNSFRLIISAWSLGYTSTEHVRTEMKFDINLDLEIIKGAYKRSVSSLRLIESLGENSKLAGMRNALEENVKNYDAIGLNDDSISAERLNDISAIGIYNIFHISPQQDLHEPAKLLSDIISLNLGVLVDSHHLLSTDTEPIFPSLFKMSFPNLYEIIEIRQLVYNCYEKVLIGLRNQDSNVVSISSRRQMERKREMQMTNLKKILELIDESTLYDKVGNKVAKYCTEKYGKTFNDLGDMWFYVIDQMDASDLDFFMEILPNIRDKNLYKKIDRKMSTIRNR